MSDRFLSRWSRLKRQDEAPPSAPPPAAPAPAVEQVPAAPATEAAPPAAAEAALPPVDSLDFAADFSAFMQKEVSEALRRTALRKLFSDPHFHFEQMDKLDIYIDDYSVSDPIPADVMQRLRQFEVFLKDDEAAAAAPDVPAEGSDEVDEKAAPPSGNAALPAAQSGPSGEPDAAPDPSPDAA